MLANEATLTVIDFESTGRVDSYPDEPWQIGMVLFRNGRVDQGSAFSCLLRVGQRPFNPYAPGRHALLRTKLLTAPRLPDLWPSLKPWLSDRPLCAHNASTEKRFLRQAFPLHSPTQWVDTLKLARIAYPHLPSHKLEDLLTSLQLATRVNRMCPGLEPHDALYDAVACAVLLETMLRQPTWEGIALETLMHGTAPAITPGKT